MSEFKLIKSLINESTNTKIVLIFILFYLINIAILGNSSTTESNEIKTAALNLNEKSIIEDLTPTPTPTIEKPRLNLESLKFTSPILEKTILKKKYSKNPLIPHKGILIKTDSTNVIYPTLEGKVVAIDKIEGLETVIILDHGNNLYTVYANLERISVVEGEQVPKNKSLGTIKKLKDLYFQINLGIKTIDPSTLINF